MPRSYADKNLQKTSFRNENLSYANFAHSDLRGADFTGADLTGADFTDVKTGIRPPVTISLFIASLIVSAFSGYVATLAGNIVQHMVSSQEAPVKVAGFVCIAAVVLFIVIAYLRGIGSATRHVLIPIALVTVAIGIIPYLSGATSGKGMLYLILCFLLVIAMFVVGTIARAIAGSISAVLFIIVALTGGIFGKSLGGGIGAAVMAVGCAMISKRALSGTKGFETLTKIASYVTAKFGTSFRHAELADANFSHLKVHNADFTGADVMRANWFEAKKINCVDDTVDDVRK